MACRILFILITVILTCLPTQALSSAPALDETALCNNLAQMFTRHPDMTDLTGNDLRIELRQAVQVGTNTYYAVKVGLTTDHPKAASLPFPMTFVTEPTGTLLLNSAMNLKTGEEGILSQAADVTRIEFPASVTPTVLATGTGKADVIFVADPFCPHCRKGYGFLESRLESIHRIRMAHNPLTPSNGSAVAAWVMEYAMDKGIQPQEVVKFSFTALKPIPPRDGKGAPLSSDDISMNILGQYKKRFPRLFGPVNGDLKKTYDMLINNYAKPQIDAHQQLKKAGFTSSPIFIVDGRVIKGMSPKDLTSALGGNHIISATGEMCGDDCTE